MRVTALTTVSGGGWTARQQGTDGGALSFAARADDVPITEIVANLTKQLG